MMADKIKKSQYLELYKRIESLIGKSAFSDQIKASIQFNIAFMLSLIAFLLIFIKARTDLSEFTLIIGLICIPYIFLVYIFSFFSIYKLKKDSNLSLNDLQRNENLYKKFTYYEEISKLINHYENYNLDELIVDNVYFKGDFVNFNIYINGQCLHIETNQYVKRYDDSRRRIEGHIVKENVFHGFKKNDLRSIVLYNY